MKVLVRMAKTATVRDRIGPELKKKAEAIVARPATNHSEVVNVLCAQTILRRRIPVELK